jgi:hypothetical protein
MQEHPDFLFLEIDSRRGFSWAEYEGDHIVFYAYQSPMYWLKAKGLVEPANIEGKKGHWHRLTDLGRRYQL